MYAIDAIEAINFEQLATATDRLLLCGGRVSARVAARPAAASGVAGAADRAGPAELAELAELADADSLERTIVVRPRARISAGEAAALASGAVVSAAVWLLASLVSLL